MSAGRHRRRSWLSRHTRPLEAVTILVAIVVGTVAAIFVGGEDAPARSSRAPGRAVAAVAGLGNSLAYLRGTVGGWGPRRAALAPAAPARPSSCVVGTTCAGTTLSAIAKRFFGSPSLWPRLYATNVAVVGKYPDVLRTGERLALALAARGMLGSALPVIAPATTPPTTTPPGPSPSPTPTVTVTGLSGTLGCSQLGQLWLDAGGSPSLEVTMEGIAMAESTGNQFATGANGEEGYWQINPSNDGRVLSDGFVVQATYDPMGNARDAVELETAGGGLSNWSTWTHGLFSQFCGA